MFETHARLAPGRLSDILKSAERAARRIPPAFPLAATVAVNPFLGQGDEDLATASARLARVAGISATQAASQYALALREGKITDEDLTAALAASPFKQKPADISALKAAATNPDTHSPIRPFPTVADLAAELTGTDWPSVIEKSVGLWAAGHFDQGQALWSPTPGMEAYDAWRAWAMHDLTPEIAGLSGFCAHVCAIPDTAERAILRASGALGLSEASAETVFHRLYMDLGGWSQHARWLLWQAELAGGSDQTLVGILAIRLIWEEALLAHVPGVADKWAQTVAAHGETLMPGAGHIALAILQDAMERAHQRHLANALGGLEGSTISAERPFLQAAFCIDVRSEVYRRALESVDPTIETIGFAGFFGLPLSHKAKGSDIADAHLPVLLSPAIETTSHCDTACEHEVRITARTVRAWGRFRQAAVSSFAFVEAAGPLYAAKLVSNALGLSGKATGTEPTPRPVAAMAADTKADMAATVLKAMSLHEGHGKIVLLLGHGGHVTNNPHESAYQCGACGGHTGEVSARLLAEILNEPETRAGLADRGISLPQDTLFVAGLHDTTSDEVTLFDQDVPTARAAELQKVRSWLQQAGRLARAERAPKLPRATEKTVAARAYNWAEVRPEWGLAGCAAFIAAPRNATSGRNLGGRAFLHSYDWQADQGFGVLELILTAPVVVASWISLQYYGSSIAPDVFGGGNKLIHNVVGGIGVIEGNGGRLRPGLPMQTVHDGERLVHEPLRLSVMIEAPREAIADVLARHPGVRSLFDNGWLHLFALKDGKLDARYHAGLCWSEMATERLAA